MKELLGFMSRYGSWSMVVAISIALGALVTIVYCSSLNFYPSGLSIADSLFFLWVLFLFGAMYSLVVLIFYEASALIALAITKPLNMFTRKFGTDPTEVPIPAKDAIVFDGLYGSVSWLLLGIWFFFVQPSLVPTVVAFGLIVVMILLLRTVKSVTDDSLNSDDLPIVNRRARLGTYAFCIIVICSAPLMFVDGVREQLTNKTLEKMGVRQLSVDVKFEEHALNSLKQHSDVKRVIDEDLLVIDEQGWVYNIDILFSNVGTNSRIRLANSVDIDVPISKIELVVRP